MKTGAMWLFSEQTSEELKSAWAYFRKKHGEVFTGKIYAREPKLSGIEEDPKVQQGVWLFEFDNPQIESL